MPLLLLLFLIVPVAELYVLIQVGEAIGALPTIALLIADSILGSWLVRRQGRAAWRRFRATLAAGRVPTREVADGALVILGGALLLAPGFITDAFGAALLAPPLRALVRRLALRRLVGGRLPRSPRRRPYDVDGTAYEVGPGRLGR